MSTWRVGKRVVTMTIPKIEASELAHIAVEWAPTMPARLSSKERRQYRQGRTQALAEIAGRLGINVVLLDV